MSNLEISSTVDLMQFAQKSAIVDIEKQQVKIAGFFENVVHLPKNKAADAALGVILWTKKSVTNTNPRGFLANNVQLDTFFGAVVAATMQDLSINPQNKECYFVAFKGQVQLIPSARGLVKLAAKAQTVANVETWVIFRDEQFEYYLDGEKVVFKYKPNFKTGVSRTWKDIVFAVCRLTHTNGKQTYSTLSFDELEARRRVSPMANSDKATPYTLWPKEMAEVKVVKHALRLLSFSSDLPTRPDTIDETIYTVTDSGLEQKAVEYDEAVFITADETAQFEALQAIKETPDVWELVEIEKDGQIVKEHKSTLKRQKLKELRTANPSLYSAIFEQAKAVIENIENNKNNPIGDAR